MSALPVRSGVQWFMGRAQPAGPAAPSDRAEAEPDETAPDVADATNGPRRRQGRRTTEVSE